MSTHPPRAHASDYHDGDRYAASKRVTLMGAGANLVLTAAQVVIGLVGNSQALVADGMHTLSDLVTDLMVLFALKHGRKAADTEHPYGHARIETAVTMLLGVVLFAVGIGIAARAGINLATAQAFVPPAALALWTAVFTLAAKEAMYRYTMRVAVRHNSNMLRANAWHHRSDAVSSLIVVFGIGGSLFGFGYMDSIAAVVVALMVVKIGAALSWQAAKELVDTGLAPKDVETIRRTILSVSGVKALHMLRTRRLGEQALVDVHVLVDERLSVSEGHQISETVRARLMRDIGQVADALVHIDTEEDIQGPSCAGLPLRDEALKRLEHHFRRIPEAQQIDRATLHYLNGRIEVELLLPLAAVSGSEQARKLTEAFNQAVRDDRQFGQIKIMYF